MAKALVSKKLKAAVTRMKSDTLTAGDKRLIAEHMGEIIKLRELMERATKGPSGKKIVAKLPFGFDIVK